MIGEEKERKKRDPIFTACFVIFMIAVVGILGVYVNEHYIQKDNTEAALGDTVTVNYTGSFYDYVGEENAVVFDTSYSSVGDNDSIIKSNDFTKKNSYSTLEFTVGKGTMLEMFENAVIGHKVGDKIRVTIPAGEGYVGPDTSVETSKTGFRLPLSETITSANFEDIYPDLDLKAGTVTEFKSVYGWDATAVMSGSEVIVSYKPVVGETYTYDADGDENFGKVEFNVTSASAGSITTNVTISETKNVGSDGAIQMIKLHMGNDTWYITNDGSSDFTYKVCNKTDGGEKVNETLYFEIEIVSIN